VTRSVEHDLIVMTGSPPYGSDPGSPHITLWPVPPLPFLREGPGVRAFEGLYSDCLAASFFGSIT
jgi:hypothetical protein